MKYYLIAGIMKKGFKVFYNEKIPTNDGGISFGQLHVASAIMESKI